MWGNRVKINKVDSAGKKITNLKKWLKSNPNSDYFDSMLEWHCNDLLVKANITFTFHPDKIVYIEPYEIKEFLPAHISKKAVKSKNIKKGDLIKAEIKTVKIQGASYTPDFLILYNGYEYYIESKGYMDESFKIRWKMFRSQLKENQRSYMVKSVKDLKELLILIYSSNEI